LLLLRPSKEIIETMRKEIF